MDFGSAHFLCHFRCPDWLIKWTALVLQYVELERSELPSVLLRLPPIMGRYTELSAKIEADVSKGRGSG